MNIRNLPHSETKAKVVFILQKIQG